MLILAFESSCDETSAAVVSTDGEHFTTKSNIIASQVDIHRLYGGVVPEIASRAHIDAISRITYEALDGAGVTLAQIDLVAVTANPGLIGALLVGVNFAKALAYANKIPLVAVDHIRGHVGAAYLDVDEIPKPPFVSLVVSGGHTSIYNVKSHFDYELIGTTRDDAAGEAFDKVGRILGLPYPAGAGFDKMARDGFVKMTGKAEDFYRGFDKILRQRLPDIKLPSPAISDGSFDFSFSGLKTAAVNLLHKYEQRGEKFPDIEFAAAYTFTAVSAIAKVLDAAVEKTGASAILLSGGVAANSHLRYMVGEVAKKHKITTHMPPPSLCGDNAAMIAVAGYYTYLHGGASDIYLNASASDGI